MMDTRQNLIKKYSIQAPRYTSYPSVLHFHEIGDISKAMDPVAKRNKNPRPLSLYIHIPFCSSLCWYCGCTKVITRRQSDSRKYLDRLFSEMEQISHLHHPGNRVVQVHFGGGSPGFLTPGELRETGRRIRSLFCVDESAEFAVEVDPRDLTRDHIDALAEIGCNRVSIGVQDIREDIQKAVNRIQPMSLNEKVVSWFRNAGIHRINIDLIYGLPFQNTQHFKTTLETVKTLDPDRFAIFNYAHIPRIIPSQKLLDRYPMPDAYEKFSILEMMIDDLKQSGYLYIGMDHFAKAGDKLAVAQKKGTLHRNFQGYTTRSDTDIYGFGMSSISQIGNSYLQSVKNLEAYNRRIDQGSFPFARHYVLTRDDCIRRYTIIRLMCDLEIDFEKIGSRWNISVEAYFADALASLEGMADDGLITWNPRGFRVTGTGRMFLRNIATAFDAYYAKTENRGNYSKTV